MTDLLVPQNKISEFLELRANAQEVNSYIYDIKDQLDKRPNNREFDIALTKTRLHINGKLATTMLSHLKDVLEDERATYMEKIANMCGVQPQNIFITVDGEIHCV